MSPQKPNRQGLSLEVLYNYVPVLTTDTNPRVTTQESGVDYRCVGQCAVPKETCADLTCLPDTSSMAELVGALEQLLGLSDIEIKTSCDELVAFNQRAQSLEHWLELIRGVLVTWCFKAQKIGKTF